MSSNRDRAELNFAIDGDVKAVLEFMQENIPTEKLLGIAEKLPELARLLWAGFPQEPCTAISLERSKTAEQNRTPPVSTESSRVPPCVDDDSVAAMVCR